MPPNAPTDPAAVTFARRILAARQARYQAFPDVDFADAEWGILLDLFVSTEEGEPVSLSSLVVSSGVPKTTALRTIEQLRNSGHLTREPDPKDGRRNHAFLSPEVHARMRQLLRQMMKHFEHT